MTRVALLALLAGALLGACGQTGKLYLPEAGNEGQGEIVTRPTQTPPPESSEAGKSSNSPPNVGAPNTPDSPAPEVTAPRSADPAEKEKKEGAKTPPSDTQPKN